MNEREYSIFPANPEQREGITAFFKLNEKNKQENVMIYIAEDFHRTPVGRIVITERNIPKPLEGKRWYVYNLFVNPEHRRRGIATALVSKTMEEAEKAGVLFIYGSANASVEASFFWMKQGFSMYAYGRKQDDPAMPLFFGNYFHIFSHCFRTRRVLDPCRSDLVRKLPNGEIFSHIDTYMSDSVKKAHYLNRAEELTGFAVCGENGEVIGASLALPESMRTPLDSVQLFVEVFVKEEYRKNGVGGALVFEMYRYAKAIGAIQLTNTSNTAEHIGFWYEMGFDVFFWDANPNTGEYGTTAMLRVK